MTVKVNINVQIVPFGSYHLNVLGNPEEIEESGEEKKVIWPYELPSHTGSIHAPVTLWGTTPVPTYSK